MRELTVLGTASQVPTASRNHNGYFLRWDAEGLLFDPGEGTQRQMLYAGVPASDVTRICVTHFHGDHCFGLPGVLSRMRLDGVARPVDCHYPESGREDFARLRWVPDEYAERVVRERPAAGVRQTLAEGDFGTLTAVRLSHGVDCYGYRLVEPDGRRMLPEALRAAGVRGPDIGRLQKEGRIEVEGRAVTLEEVSEHRPGQVAAFVMDTGLCDGVYELAERADLLVIESTFLNSEVGTAGQFGHLTAGQAARVAAESGVRSLVLTHFSQRYPVLNAFETEAREYFDGEMHVARDLDRIPVPKRLESSPAAVPAEGIADGAGGEGAEGGAGGNDSSEGVSQ